MDYQSASMRPDEIATARCRIRDYLLGPQVQIQQGELCGAVAGTVTASGDIDYVYGEITGYYLHWLASLHDQSPLIRQRAQAAHDWLARTLPNGLPPTRVYLDAATQDWRNQACFVFDLAMIAGGLACSIEQQLIKPDPELLSALQRHLNCFVADGRLLTVRKLMETAELPQRWSTLGGPFSAKTASRILQLNSHVELDAPLTSVCQSVLQKICNSLPGLPPEMVHPTLYALEGCLLCPTLDYALLAQAFEAIAVLAAADGSLPEAQESPEVRRSDIVAQALRIGVILHYRGALKAELLPVLATMAGCLVSRVGVDGSIPFDPAKNAGANIWSGMFAEQALRLYLALLQEQPLPMEAGEIV